MEKANLKTPNQRSRDDNQKSATGEIRPTKQKVAIQKEREVVMYAEMWHTSKCLLQHGQEQPIGRAHQFRASLVFTAFALEAFLNHVGPHLFGHWEYLERLSPKKKLYLIAERLVVNVDMSKRPWQIIDELFEFRNEIAHGKTKKFKPPLKIRDAGKDELPAQWIAQTPWEAFCTERNAIKGRKDVEKIVTVVCNSARAKNVDVGWPFFSGFQTGETSLYKK